MASASIIIWEWLDEHGRWRPYDPHVSDYIEQEYVKHQTPHSGAYSALSSATYSFVARFVGAPGVSLGAADPVLSRYFVDFVQMQQLRPDTGKQRFCHQFPAGYCDSCMMLHSLSQQELGSF